MPVAAPHRLRPIANTDEGAPFSNSAEAKVNTIDHNVANAGGGGGGKTGDEPYSREVCRTMCIPWL